MILHDISRVPTSDDIFHDLHRKYIWNGELCKRASNYDLFDINGEEFYISEVKDLQITFSSIESDKEIKRYIEDLQGIKETGYCLIWDD